SRPTAATTWRRCGTSVPPPVDVAPAIAVRNLRKAFGEVRAVEDLSFSVETGQVCGLLGPNGAGKTTTLRMLLGLVRPDAGEARLLDVRVRPGHPVLARVGALVEGPSFVPYLS